MSYRKKIGVLIVFSQILLSVNGLADSSKNDSLAQIDMKASSLYSQWLQIHDTNLFKEASSLFTDVFLATDKDAKYSYALKLARLYKTNKEDSQWLKAWYVRAMDAFNSRNPDLNKGLTSYQILEEKYAVLFEFTKVYSREYGQCEDAVEVLRVYKTEYSFKYIHYNRGLDQTDKIWLRMVKEDRYLSWECK
jgi:hypothetical protein